jgi:Transposase DDE domain group 1
VKRTSWSHGLSVSADGMGVVPLAGAVAVRLLADRVGLTDALSTALSRGGFVPVHDRGRVWVDIATMLAAGGEAIADIDTLRHQSELLGVVASPPTVWRALDEATSTALKRVEKARAQTRRHVWSQLACVPASKAAGGDLGETVVLDVDATLIISHSEKEQATATFKHGFGFHPIGVWCDNTAELLAIMLRPGNAGSNHAGEPHRGVGSGDHPDPGGSSQAAADPSRWCRRHPPAVGLVERPGPGPGPPHGVFGRVPDQECRSD